MVRLSQRFHKKHSLLSAQFLDSVSLRVKGGHGGNGFPKFGGIGGQGGAVYLRAKENVFSLRHVVKKYSLGEIVAGDGEDSSKNRIVGRRGVDVQVEVPVGVTVLSDTGKSLGDLDRDGCTCLAAYGGGGGTGGNNFIGQKGQNWKVTLNLKLIADVGLVGFPNAGKSTFLRAISNAKTKVASYPFTTIKPNVGVVNYEDYRQISIADLPGLIEGAHKNVGMGHKFLKHVERTKLLIYIVDLFGFQLSPSHPKRSCMENIFSLIKEIEMYDPELFGKPSLLLLNKIDSKGADQKLNEVKEALNDLESCRALVPQSTQPTRIVNFDSVIPVSTLTGENIVEAKQKIRKILDMQAEQLLLQAEASQ